MAMAIVSRNFRIPDDSNRIDWQNKIVYPCQALRCVFYDKCVCYFFFEQRLQEEITKLSPTLQRNALYIKSVSGTFVALSMIQHTMIEYRHYCLELQDGRACLIPLCASMFPQYLII